MSPRYRVGRIERLLTPFFVRRKVAGGFNYALLGLVCVHLQPNPSQLSHTPTYYAADAEDSREPDIPAPLKMFCFCLCLSQVRITCYIINHLGVLKALWAEPMHVPGIYARHLLNDIIRPKTHRLSFLHLQ